MNSKLHFKIGRYLLIIIIMIPVVFPLIWIILASVKTQSQIVNIPPIWIFKPTFENYKKVFVEQNFFQYLMNSSIIAVFSTLLSLVIGLPAAYSISKYKQKKLGIFILIARLMPGISFLIPWFILFSRLRVIDTYQVLIASHMLVAFPQ